MWTGYYQGLVEALPQLRLQMPGITFDGSMELHGKRQSARLVAFAGGHTGDDAVLDLPQAGVIFMSDLLFVGFHPYLADGDPIKLRQALEALSQLPAQRFVPGHGAVGSLADVRLLIEYIDDCSAIAKELVETRRLGRQDRCGEGSGEVPGLAVGAVLRMQFEVFVREDEPRNPRSVITVIIEFSS